MHDPPVPVELQRGSHGQQDEGHHRVADGHLSPRPRDDVIDTPPEVRALEVRPDVVPQLGGGTEASLLDHTRCEYTIHNRS